ncbi:hypothetical protein K439DRAFT_814497 [Ramaria rubella]|nr:hypothetical protein K439DRAFT_814497 [Ramaria rubella]
MGRVDDITCIDIPPAHSTLCSPHTLRLRRQHPITSITSVGSMHLQGDGGYQDVDKDEDVGAGAEWDGNMNLCSSLGRPIPILTPSKDSSSPFRPPKPPPHPHPHPLSSLSRSVQTNPLPSPPTLPFPPPTPTRIPSPRPSTLAVNRDSSHNTCCDSSSINHYQHPNQNQTATSTQYQTQYQYQYQHDPRTPASNPTSTQPPHDACMHPPPPCPPHRLPHRFTHDPSQRATCACSQTASSGCISCPRGAMHAICPRRLLGGSWGRWRG